MSFPPPSSPQTSSAQYYCQGYPNNTGIKRDLIYPGTRAPLTDDTDRTAFFSLSSTSLWLRSSMIRHSTSLLNKRVLYWRAPLRPYRALQHGMSRSSKCYLCIGPLPQSTHKIPTYSTLSWLVPSGMRPHSAHWVIALSPL
jgi:hypothetical protein